MIHIDKQNPTKAAVQTMEPELSIFGRRKLQIPEASDVCVHQTTTAGVDGH